MSAYQPPAGRWLVLVAGMPGAGKSTLLARLAPGPGLRVLDSDAPRAALARLLPGVPYGAYRPLVHAAHRLAAVAAACSGTAVVAVHLPATGAATRSAVARLAALTGRSAHLVWVHAEPGDARRGQHARGRLVPRRSFAAHAARAEATTALLRAGTAPGFSTVTILDRRSVRAGSGALREGAGSFHVGAPVAVGPSR